MATIDARDAIALGPSEVWRMDLSEARPARRALVRSLLWLTAGAVRVEDADRIAAAAPGTLFALSHHNTWEALVAPTALVALRRGRRVRFLVDWMFAELPFTSWLVDAADPIPVYAKRARFGLRERRRRRLRDRHRFDPVAEARAALAAGVDVAIYPEGSRQRDPERLGALRPGVARLALATGAPLVPVGVELPAHARLGRLPKVGRVVLRVGDTLVSPSLAPDATPAARREAERALLERLERELARLSRKSPRPVPRTPRKESDMRLGSILASSPTPTLVTAVESAADREAALAVIDEVYRAEKRWIASSAEEIAASPGADPKTLWLLARVRGEAVGVMRIVFDPELRLPASLGVELEPGVDIERLAEIGRFAEIGRMMVKPAERRRPKIVLALMKAALAAALERGTTHFLTAVFENDPHSPHDFHVRQLGFERVGTHERGELRCESRRILLVLDLARAWERLGRGRRSGVAAELARGYEERLSERLADRLVERVTDRGSGAPVLGGAGIVAVS